MFFEFLIFQEVMIRPPFCLSIPGIISPLPPQLNIYDTAIPSLKRPTQKTLPYSLSLDIVQSRTLIRGGRRVFGAHNLIFVFICRFFCLFFLQKNYYLATRGLRSRGSFATPI